MPRKFLTLFIFLWGYNAMAQQEYSILLQSENNMAFYVKINGNLFNSSDKGHLIIPLSKDSVEKIRIGFSQNSEQEMDFLIIMNGSDQSFTLKNINERGWVLSNNRTMAIISPLKGDALAINEKNVSERDPFTELMAGVVNDSSILQKNDWELEDKQGNPSLKSEPANTKKEASFPNAEAHKDSATALTSKNDSIKAVAQATNSRKLNSNPKKSIPQIKDTVTKKVPTPPISESAINQEAHNDSSIALFAKNDSVKTTGYTNNTHKLNPRSQKHITQIKDTVLMSKRSNIKKLDENRTDTSLNMSFVDIPDKGPMDTVNILIPVESQKFQEKVTAQKSENLQPALKEAVKTSLPTTTTTEHHGNNIQNTEKPNLADSIKLVGDSSLVRKNVSLPRPKADTIRKTAARIEFSTVNKSCKSFASDYDIDRLRIKMLAMDNDDDRISAARSVFKQKCFSVKQVRALSELFYTDEGRYKLLDATYTHVSDMGEFIQLQDLLSDPYYIKRFNAMIR